ncbi:arsenate reductase (glutaredoxin) [Devosia sp. MC521]|uniref:arsenate reductase (glutaredoxin) n=1 Tax=Devosia sp. MC521 TaxID=2759954 RepID=UPI0015FAC7AA|nr:arsenate reductase (glutaredoxin) [Devosia sp. MC521]MBJ6987987.1 arsenate reductase (glutaredoxin) [Devosia sp. MC521]QMW62060.1 arsenate reductase (glutaredoxin) [Devosia sp. MC521]
MHITIYHNPECGTSRNTLAMIRGTGIEPEIVLYLENPPSAATLADLIARAGISVRDAIRTKQPEYLSQGLDNPELSDTQLLAAMVATPILINRPLVVTPHGVRLCRPSELVLDILPEAATIPFTKEDGEVVIDKDGQRI